MDADVQQLSLLDLDEPPKSESPLEPQQHERRHETTASDTPRKPRQARSGAAAPAAPDNGTLLTTEEVATLLHVHPRTVQRLVARGQLAAVHLGGAVRFDPDDLADLITAHKRRGRDAAQPARTPLRATRGARISFADRLRSEGT